MPNLATNLNNPRCQAAQPDYTEGVAYALSKLALPNVYHYIDVAHGGWLGWEDNQRKIAVIFKAVIRNALSQNPGSAKSLLGFVSNVSNYSPLFGLGTSPEIGKPVQVQNGLVTYQGKG